MVLTSDTGTRDGEERAGPVGYAKLDIAEHVHGRAREERELKSLSGRDGEGIDVNLLYRRIY